MNIDIILSYLLLSCHRITNTQLVLFIKFTKMRARVRYTQFEYKPIIAKLSLFQDTNYTNIRHVPSRQPPKDTANKKTLALTMAVIKVIRQSCPDNYRTTIRCLRAVKLVVATANLPLICDQGKLAPIIGRSRASLLPCGLINVRQR